MWENIAITWCILIVVFFLLWMYEDWNFNTAYMAHALVGLCVAGVGAVIASVWMV